VVGFSTVARTYILLICSSFDIPLVPPSLVIPGVAAAVTIISGRGGQSKNRCPSSRENSDLSWVPLGEGIVGDPTLTEERRS